MMSAEKSDILLKLSWFLMAEEKLSILLLIISSILSLEANFLDRLSIILPWFWTKSLKGEKLLEKLLP
jgi:hypothetical protein